jgi:hypothetical protein
VARASKRLDELAQLLERTGGDPQRLDAVKRAQSFRRSWIELAEALHKIRRESSFERWGYDDFYAYCHEELTLKRATVNKLTISYRTLERHAPQVLTWDGVAKTIPSYQAIDYFSRAVGDEDDDGDEPDAETSEAHPGDDGGIRRKRPPPRAGDALHELSTAVFDEGQPITELRRRFDPVFFPRPRGAERLAVLGRASAAARRLAELLPDIEGLPEAQVRKLEAELGKLRSRLDELAEPLREKVAEAQKRLKPPRVRSTGRD